MLVPRTTWNSDARVHGAITILCGACAGMSPDSCCVFGRGKTCVCCALATNRQRGYALSLGAPLSVRPPCLGLALGVGVDHRQRCHVDDATHTDGRLEDVHRLGGA